VRDIIVNNLKILVLNHEYPPVGGGGGKITQNLCEGLAADDYQIRILTTHFKGLPLYESNEVEVYRIKAHREQIFRASFQDMFLFIGKSVLKGWRIIHRWKPDLIHAHFAVPAGAAAFLLSRLTGTPYMLTIHGGDVPDAAPEKTAKWFKIVYPFSKIIWKNARKIIAVSDYVRDLAQEKYDVPIQVIGNGINLEQYTPSKFDQHPSPRIIFAGRLSPEKNPLAVVHSLSEIRDKNWECIILGDGIMMPELRTLIEKKDLQDRIILKGWVTQGEVLQWMGESDILFMPSLMEGLPITGLQGLARGLAMVMSRTGGCVHLVREEQNGYLIEPGDIIGYTKAISELLTDPIKLLAFRKASARFASQFSIKAVVDAYDKVFRDLLDGSAS
jgi:glycosyltransferase involved in cell wall biosynthesis